MFKGLLTIPIFLIIFRGVDIDKKIINLSIDLYIFYLRFVNYYLFTCLEFTGNLYFGH